MKYENYPVWIIILANCVSLTIYSIGVYVILLLGTTYAVVYFLYLLYVEYALLKKSCTNCYYYGKFCAMGKGKLASIFFSKGEQEKFLNREISWRSIIPDILVMAFPLTGGIILLLQRFSWLVAGLLLCLLMLSFAGNAFIRGCFACKYCGQKELGCPADKFFNNDKR